MTKQLTPEQFAALSKYERFFKQAVEARYCSWPGEEGVNEMLRIWNEVTGEGRKRVHGCSTCTFLLVLDVANLYNAQKAAAEAAKASEQSNTPAEPKKPVQPKKTTKAKAKQ